MNKRTIVVLVLAVVLMLIVMGMAALLYLTDTTPHQKWSMSALKSAPAPKAESMKVIDLTGDGKHDIFLQSLDEVLVMDATLNRLFDQTYQTPATTMGDFNGDGVDDLLVAYKSGNESVVAEAMTGTGKKLWSQALPDLRDPARATSVDFEGDKVREVVIGDLAGNLVCLNSDGKVRWQTSLSAPAFKPEDPNVRGLDDVRTPQGTRLVAANTYGQIVLLDAAGQPLWQYEFPSSIRRVRSYDMNGDGTSEIVVGGESGRLECLEAATRRVLWSQDLGFRVSEIREAQLDNDPKTLEILVGTKDSGLIYGYNAKGELVSKNYLSGKVVEFLALDLDEDGKQEFIAGNEDGEMKLYKPNQDALAQMSLSGGLGRLDAGQFAKNKQFIAAGGQGVDIVQIRSETAPRWYNSLTAGFVACLVIAVLAFIVANLKPQPKLQYTAEDMSIEGLRAKRKMLLETMADLKRSLQTGEVPAEAFEARARGLREQIAAAEAELLRLGAKYEPTMMKCPNCGASLELGEDRCPYCGTTIV